MDHPLITPLYSAFNRRDIGAALALMRPDVSWPKASEGGRVVGTAAIRDYWTRQWQSFDPYVEPKRIETRDDGTLAVEVRQVVKAPTGELLSDGIVWHIYTLADGLVQRMEIGERTPGEGSAAFPHAVARTA